MTSPENHERIRASMERLFMEGFNTGWAAMRSGRYGGAEQPPPVEVTWNGTTPTFVVKRESISLSNHLHLPKGFDRGAN